METTNEDNSKEVTTDLFPFDFKKFDFLDKCLKETKEEFGIKTTKIQITCFDVNQNFFVFATNYGIIYCFRRNVFNSQQLYKYRLFSSPINLIKLITDELLSFVTESGIYVWNRLNKKFLYGWKCPTKAYITCIQTFMSINDQKLLLFSGDSEGCVRFHDLIKCHQNSVYTDFGFQIIQIEFINSTNILISSSCKTVIVGFDFSDPNKQKVTTVGKNERKTYGKYGAVYSQKSSLIYGSRPSLHLVKAEPNGNVIETIRINYIKETECPQSLEVLTQRPIVTGKLIYKLGTLQLFCNDQYIISMNDSNLLIIRTDGQFCLKEKVNNMVDIKISAANSNDAFVLLESKHIIRIRNNKINSYSDFDVSSEFEKSTESEPKSSDSRSSNESLFNLIKGPVILNQISYIDEELKKVFDFNAIQSKLSKKYNQLSTSIISTIDPKILPNSDKNVFVEPDFYYKTNEAIEPNSPTKDGTDSAPLVVKRKAKRKTRHNSSESVLTTNSTTDSVNSNEEVVTNDMQLLDDNVMTTEEILDKQSNIKLEDKESNEDNRLIMILSAFKEANPISDPIVDQTEDQDFHIELNSYLSETDSCRTAVPNDYQIESEEYKENVSEITIIKSSEEESIETELRKVEYNWELLIDLYETKENKSLVFSSFCANGYNSGSEIGLIWFRAKDNKSLVYYPSFDSLKLSKGHVTDMTCAYNELYVLNDAGFIFKREGMDATKPVGTKWTQLRGNKNRFKLTSISLNTKNSILWCCDSNGETWTHQITAQKWTVIKDYSSLSIEMRKVCVSIFDSTIVWGLDKSGKVFVRSFDKSSDKDNDFSGDQWLLMDGILAIDIVVCCDNSVLIADQNNQLFRRSAKIKTNEQIFEWRPVTAPDVSNCDLIVNLSVTENNDLMVMTAKGYVFHSFIKQNRQSAKDTDMDWLLI